MFHGPSSRSTFLAWAMAAASLSGSAAGCSPEDAGAEADFRVPTETVVDEPESNAQAVSLLDIKSCLAGLGHAGNITAASMFGSSVQSGTSIAKPCLLGLFDQCAFPLADCYLVVSSGNAAAWSTSSSVAAGGACEPDPVFGTLCDKGGVTVSVFVPAGKTRITFDYRFFEWDQHPFEDPFSVTLYDPADMPVASTGSHSTCEFSSKSSASLAIGSQRAVELDVSAYQGQTVKVEFRASDRYDQSLDAGALVNNLRVVSGAMSCGGSVCGGCAGAASCTAVDADGDGVNACDDCDDSNASVKPGNPEACNGVDDDCSGAADEGGVCCVDGDGDGQTDCDGDCDDADPTVYPGAPEICDATDNDCDSAVDEGTCVVECTTIANGVDGGVTADAALLGDHPTTPDFGQSSGYTGVSSGGNENFVLFHFDMAPIEAQAGGMTVNVTSATFQVYVTWNTDSNQVAVHGCDAPWDESTVTLAGYPLTGCDASPVSTFDAGGAGYRGADVTALAGAWLNGLRPNHGFVLREPPIKSHAYWLKGSSASLQPKLEVCYFLSAPPAPGGG